MNYSLYLFSNLIKLFDSNFEKLEYDLQFSELPERYKAFEDSSFNDEKKGEYDCIIAYLKDEYCAPKLVDTMYVARSVKDKKEIHSFEWDAQDILFVGGKAQSRGDWEILQIQLTTNE